MGENTVISKCICSMVRVRNRASVFGGQRTDDGPPVHVNVFGNPLEASGVTVSVHPYMPEQNNTPGELFFECTLFLYSVLALFLQYLNLYKTMWWLPYWHYSLKFHQINPYFLSCVGLLLGVRVTKCFWKTITEVVEKISVNLSPFSQSCITVFEYAFIKTPMMTMVVTSFMFSFSKVCNDFPAIYLMQFSYPWASYITWFSHEINFKVSRIIEGIKLAWNGSAEFSEVIERFCEPAPQSLDHESIAHMCSSQPAQIREEILLLFEDLFYRFKRCTFAGVSTAFLSIYLPLSFAPHRTNYGMTQKILVDSLWEFELFAVVCLTAFCLYMTYLFPLNYIDLLYRASMHLGKWDLIQDPSSVKACETASKWSESVLYQHGAVVMIKNHGVERFYMAIGNPKIGTVAAQPGVEHQRFFMKVCKHPLSFINLMCILECCIIASQFWMLVLTTEWQHICTLVLLMFANYLLLAKVFKDKVFLGRIYEPSPEDQALVDQLRKETKLE